ncbi:MAG: bifunctional phosphoribosylaminoimidazolecarboxamide formyltransferase/inosine monophosphate cyclohydrolase [Candidatus Lambdaproteobacteria bacterium RIFOXYD1_FULL_56_27]|uniref:Bifunctional purine biosynthesis protein PurH n=1 Tax=Candidatus Lambdaproteobacteria bacterium RIFOXYD2_FULL_56_26 TaxID=1817773 RepID=A0A1F6GS20_9PROT|nr:MAG: bifunctional phosphoribosylaminoimidazolecarboxamide formyltransferase/inosine monophosphate cyclohydrolase [Candidatus Lambdaproteobacteria bacterium RIFOXYC1_FULL_56_13]OGH00880.1 MAG: bifunctional phosphoribosylaminoimidazolecarboxamide formyltransferase/inosine monophosphate cyclohydrolase [Candidatus Lambdaproteobacteria bacterium RIFOXYD2_FULL_56_26]OGH08132.1 MAG: bifunctional phosphoribosylaminoimidazolecarboxamide formyltransferase/inosine monophosphate cyclohydrolase [Candidatus
MKAKRALVSVSDKTGIIDFVKELHKLGLEILSTGGTAKALRDGGLPVKDVSEVTGFPEIMDGRVKTLHPKIHGGLLARRDKPEHLEALQKLEIGLIDLVVINLYPFLKVTADPKVDLETAIENIDIGGPAMLRASAKNYAGVAVITDPADYPLVLKELAETGEVSLSTKGRLAIKAYRLTSAYDAAIDEYLSRTLAQEERIHLTYGKGQTLRYGENSHQKASFYLDEASKDSSVARAEILNGKEMSYNNFVDANAAYEAVKDLDPKVPAVAVVKHTNPCGFATGKTAAQALERAWEGDPISAFGGVIATNQKVDMAFAEFLKGDSVKHYSYQVKDGEYVAQEVNTGKFVEVLIAPDFEPEALEFLQKKSKMIRVLKVPEVEVVDPKTLRAITGGLLVQDRDMQLFEKFEVVTQKTFPGHYQALATFTMTACKHTKSNSVILGRQYEPGLFQVMGMGAGQPNRVDSMRKLAYTKALENLKREWQRLGKSGKFEAWAQQEINGMLLASDAFLPFDDTVREAAGLGVRYLIQPGGSMRDEDSIKACNELGVAMAFTGLRHFNH